MRKLSVIFIHCSLLFSFKSLKSQVYFCFCTFFHYIQPCFLLFPTFFHYIYPYFLLSPTFFCLYSSMLSVISQDVFLSCSVWCQMSEWLLNKLTPLIFQAGLVTTLSTRTIVFGATNPKGHYDPDLCITFQ